MRLHFGQLLYSTFCTLFQLSTGRVEIVNPASAIPHRSSICFNQPEGPAADGELPGVLVLVVHVQVHQEAEEDRGGHHKEEEEQPQGDCLVGRRLFSPTARRRPSVAASVNNISLSYKVLPINKIVHHSPSRCHSFLITLLYLLVIPTAKKYRRSIEQLSHSAVYTSPYFLRLLYSQSPQI